MHIYSLSITPYCLATHLLHGEDHWEGLLEEDWEGLLEEDSREGLLEEDPWEGLASVEVECTDTCMYICSEATESGVGS